MTEQIDYEELINRLHIAAIRGTAGADNDGYLCPVSIRDARLAVSALRSLLEQREKLKEAIKPFAEHVSKLEAEAGFYLARRPDDECAPLMTGMQITMGDLRCARATLEASND